MDGHNRPFTTAIYVQQKQGRAAEADQEAKREQQSSDHSPTHILTHTPSNKDKSAETKDMVQRIACLLLLFIECGWV